MQFLSVGARIHDFQLHSFFLLFYRQEFQSFEINAHFHIIVYDAPLPLPYHDKIEVC